MHLSILQRKTYWTTLEGIYVVLANIARMRGNLCCPYKHGEEGLNEVEMRDSYLEREVPTNVEEDHDDVNEADILGFTDDDIEF
jgi:hypothetical protein